jgi:DNA-binding beta-propeller fold protein YncE
LSREARGKELLYVADDGNNTITIYQAVGKNQAPVGQITSGIDGPEGLAFANRHLYVTNTGNNTVTVYRLGHVTPSKTYSQDLAAPAGVAVGDDGTVYVTNLDGSDSVVAYAKGSTTPTRIYQGLELPIAPALDRENDLYVTYISGVEEYPPASTNGRNLGLDISNLGGIAIDASDNLIVAQQISPPEIKVFPQGATEPSKVFGQEDDPNPLTFLKSEKKIFVGEPLSNVVNVYAYPGGKSINAISNEVNLPQGLAVSPSAPL